MSSRSSASATPSPHTGPWHLPPAARRSRAAAAGLHLIFDSASDRNSDSCADSPSSYSDASFSSVSSSSGPATPLSRPSSPAIVSAAEHLDSEDCWNLIPYHVPWGNEYCDYTPGTLPGPDGQCFFLRSPTPLKYKRTVRACTKCRDRKAKCSGDRPACVRCVSRGYICQYDPEEPKRAKGPELARQRRRDKPDRTVSQSTTPGAGASSSLSVPPLASDPMHFSPKHEEVDLLTELGGFAYPFTDGHAHADPWAASQTHQAVPPEASHPAPGAAAGYPIAPPQDSPRSHSLLLQQDETHVAPPSLHMDPAYSWPYPDPGAAAHPDIPASVHAPRPMRRAQVPFLAAPQRPQPPPAAAPPIAIPQPPILQAALMPVAEPAPEPQPEPAWQNYAQAGLDAFAAQSAQELVHGYMPYDYAPAYAYTHAAAQEHAAQAYYDMAMYGQDVGVAPAATYGAPAPPPYVSYAA